MANHQTSRSLTIRQPTVLGNPARLLPNGIDRKALCSRIVLITTSYPEIKAGSQIMTDVLIIGSGAGGGVAAKILAESGRDVTVVEEGQYCTSDGYGDDVQERVRKLWRSGPETIALGSTEIAIPAGRAVGGTSVIGCGTIMRAPDHVLERWVDWGLDHLGPDELLLEFEQIEEILAVKPVPDEILGRNGEIVRDGARALGFSGGPLPRSISNCRGSGLCVIGCPVDAKQSIQLSYLPRAQINGATVIEKVRIESIMMESGRAIGARGTLLDNKSTTQGEVEFKANDVILAAGYLHSPALLANAGLGNPDHVLCHLQIHPCTGVVGIFEEDVATTPNTVQSWYVDHFSESHGLLLEATGLVSGMSPGIDISNMAFIAVFAVDTGEGDLTRSSTGGLRPRYEIHPDDIEALSFGVYQAARILLAAGACEIRTAHPGFRRVVSFSEAEEMARARWKPAYFRPVAFHPVGTARMGADPELSVVDTGGRVWGIPNLRVADASILPCCPEVNPQETIMAVAATVARSAAQ